MKLTRWITKILILSLLIVSVFVPIFLLSGTVKNFNAEDSDSFSEDLSSIKYRTDALQANVIEKEGGESLKEPSVIVYRDEHLSSIVNYRSSESNYTSNVSLNAEGSSYMLDRKDTKQGTEQHQNLQNQTDVLTYASGSNFTSNLSLNAEGSSGMLDGKDTKQGTEQHQNLQNQTDVLTYASGSNYTSNVSLNAQGSYDMLDGKDTKQGTEQHQNLLNQMDVLTYASGRKEVLKHAILNSNQSKHSGSSSLVDEKVTQMKDQVIRAKTYLELASPKSTSSLVRELKQRIKDVERAIGDSTKDSDLHRSATLKMRSMEATLSKASRFFSDCHSMSTKLRAMTHNAEERVKAHKNQASFLVRLAGRTTPKGLHCLSMQLTANYFTLPPEERSFPNQHRLHNPDLYHFAVFSDNILACSVVISSTVAASKAPEKLVFHIVTDSLNLPAMSMWFLLNPPENSTIHVENIETFTWLSPNNSVAMQKEGGSNEPRYTSVLNHLRFYLPDVFPMLNKIVLLDHDVVVQRDLTGLWSVDMKGKVNGAVETCRQDEPSFLRMDMFINVSDPFVAGIIDPEACTWAFGMNVFDLREWRRQNLVGLYHKYLRMGETREIWKGGSLPLGWLTFYKNTIGLDRNWHVLGLGYDSGVSKKAIEKAAVIHYDGIMKPWLDIGLEKYKGYWRKHVKYAHAFLQQCNIQQ